MIINSGNDQSHHNTRYTDRCLFFKIKHIISIFHFRHIGTGTVQHNQSKTSQKNDNREKTVIIIIGFLFYFWFSYNCFFSTHSIQYSRLLSRPQEKNRETAYNPSPCYTVDQRPFPFLQTIVYLSHFYITYHCHCR